MSKPFGYSYLLDCHECRPGVADNMETIYRFLEELVPAIGMTSFTLPMTVHGPRDKSGIELYPEKAGVSGCIFLIESAIVLHGMEPDNFITLDVYSCNCFDKNIVFNRA